MKVRALPLMAVVLWATTALAGQAEWHGEWPNTDFSRHSVDYAEIISGGTPRDGIPAIDGPRGQAFFAIGLPFGRAEPAIAVTIGGFENRLDGGRALGAIEAAVPILVELLDYVVTPQIMIFAAPFAVGKRGSGDGDSGQNGINHH